MKRLFGMFRVLGLALAILGVVATLTFRKAEAQLRESLRGFGDQMVNLHGFAPHSAPRQLFVNGLELNVVSVGTSLNVTEALDRFQSVCRTVGQIDLPAKVRQKLEAGSKDASSVPMGVVRQDSDEEGFLACIDLGAGMNGEAFLARLSEFGKTQNLRSLGQLRYAKARRNEGRTTLLLLWTEGDAKLAELFPKQGDAPGRDPADVPRPKDGRRLLSAYEQGMPYGFASYAIEGEARQAVAHAYEAMLVERGWQTRVTKNGSLIAEKARRRVLVRVSERRSGRVVVSLSDLG